MKLRFNSIRLDKAFAFVERTGIPPQTKYEGLLVMESDEGTVNLKITNILANRILYEMQGVLNEVVEEQLYNTEVSLFPVPLFTTAPLTGHDGLRYSEDKDDEKSEGPY